MLTSKTKTVMYGHTGGSNKNNEEVAEKEFAEFIKSLNDAPTVGSLARRLVKKLEYLNEALNTSSIRQKMDDKQILLLAVTGTDKHTVIATCKAIMSSDQFSTYTADTQEALKNIMQNNKNRLHWPQ